MQETAATALKARRPIWAEIFLIGVCALAQACAPVQDPGADRVDASDATGTTTTTPAALISATSCGELAARSVDALQSYVDAFEDVPTTAIDDIAADLQTSLDDIATALRQRSEELGCGPLPAELEDELGRLDGESPLAASIAATLRTSLLGEGVDPSDPGAETVDVADVAELQAAVGRAGTGSTIRLAAGTYQLDRTVVLFRPVTLRGPTDGTATILSSAGGAAVLTLATGDVGLTDLTIEHTGPAAASVLVIAAGQHRLDGVTITGGRASAEGTGGFGIAVQSNAADAALEVVDSTFTGNAGGGILVDGGVDPTLRRITVEGPGACGVCYAGDGAGTLADSDLTGLDIGVRLEGLAAPRMTDLRVTDNVVGIGSLGDGDFAVASSTLTRNATGIELAAGGSPTFTDVTIADSEDTGALLGGTSSPVLDGVVVTGPTPVGLALAGTGAPTIGGGTVATAGEVGVAVTGDAAGSVTGTVVTGQRIGVQVDEDATTALAGLRFEAQADVAVLVTGRASPTVTDLVCTDERTGVVLLLEAAAPVFDEPGGCPVQDQREG